jgi:septum formation protein
MDLARHNAEGKARSLAKQYPLHLILGSDQVCECEGRILGKAGSLGRALDQLRFLSGREHRLHTAVALFVPSTGELDRGEITTTLRMRALSDDRLRRYVERERPLDTAGSYYSEGLGIALFESLSGDDPTAIVGLPLVTVCRLLERAGHFPLDGVPA